MPGVIVSDNGSPSAEQWAVTTGEHVWPINTAVEGDRLLAARRVQNAIIEALVPHFQNLINEECVLLSGDPTRLHQEDFDTEGHVNAAMETLTPILQGTPWADKPEDPEWVRIMRGELARQFNTVQHIERQWHCHRNETPDTEVFMRKHNMTRVS